MNEWEAQVERLARFIVDYFPGEPSTSEGAIDTAIRLMAEMKFGTGRPRFIIQATDAFAIPTIRAHMRLCWEKKLFEQVDEETLALAEIIQWQRSHPDLVRLPDHKHVSHWG